MLSKMMERGTYSDGNNVDELRNEFNLNYTKLSTIGQIKAGDKLSKDNSNGVYYLDHCGILQRVRRWWTGQNRDKTFNDLDTDFTLFAQYLDRILAQSRDLDGCCPSQLITDTQDLVNNLMRGLYNLKNSYPDFRKLRCKIDSIILVLIDFKDSLRHRPNRPCGRERSHSFSDSMLSCDLQLS